jgi:CubicO group peptidase (beta-lactamase class C family)
MNRTFSAWLILFSSGSLSLAQPYDFSQVTTLLNSELPDLRNHVAVLINQKGREIYRFQAGNIGYDTKTHLASFTKTISAAVVLSVADSNLLRLNERLGSAFPLFQNNGIGDAAVLDCFGMRHGIETPIAFEIDRRYTLAQSVTWIGLTGVQAFTPGTQLSYDGPGMQAVGRLCEIRTGQS